MSTEIASGQGFVNINANYLIWLEDGPASHLWNFWRCMGTPCGKVSPAGQKTHEGSLYIFDMHLVFLLFVLEGFHDIEFS
jgi:hypothetical protein